MKCFVNDSGKTVYRLEQINDLALLPETEIEQALQALVIHVHTLRAILAASDSPEEIMAIAEPYIDWVCDNEISAKFQTNEEQLLSVKLVPQDQN